MADFLKRWKTTGEIPRILADQAPAQQPLGPVLERRNLQVFTRPFHVSVIKAAVENGVCAAVFLVLAYKEIRGGSEDFVEQGIIGCGYGPA